MQSTSDLYKRMISAPHWKEWRFDVGGETYIDEVFSANSRRSLFSGNPTVGMCCSGELYLNLKNVRSHDIPRGAKMEAYYRLRNLDGESSEWVRKGVYFLYERSPDVHGRDISLHGYDALLKAQQQFTSQGDQGKWPMSDIDAVEEIASRIGVELDPRTKSIMTEDHQVPYPGYGEGALTMDEVLGGIGACYAGNWVINDIGLLQLICLGDIPELIRFLLDENREPILFGGVRILV